MLNQFLQSTRGATEEGRNALFNDILDTFLKNYYAERGERQYRHRQMLVYGYALYHPVIVLVREFLFASSHRVICNWMSFQHYIKLLLLNCDL